MIYSQFIDYVIWEVEVRSLREEERLRGICMSFDFEYRVFFLG